MKSPYTSMIFLVLGLILLMGCKKIIDVGTSKNQLTTDKVFSDSTTAEAAVVSIYSAINIDSDPQYSINLSLYTDELSYIGPTQEFTDFYNSKVPVANTTNLNIWKSHYFIIYQCNDAISQLNLNRLPESFTGHTIAELKFLRAFAYYQLINFYGHIPLILTTEVNNNSKASQASAEIVWQQIITDLKDAALGLPAGYRTEDRVRANKWAAMALLAKAYLETGDHNNAFSAANDVINSGLYTPLPATTKAFLGSSKETILAIATINGFTTSAQSLIADGAPPQYPINNNLLMSFESGDQRKTDWIAKYDDNGTDYYYAFKYHNNTNNSSTPENLIVLRAAEQFLVRAEARIQLNQVEAGITDINTVRSRAGLPNLPLTLSKDAALTALFDERRHELFNENGIRLVDLKRSKKIDAVLNAEKATWTTNASILPIPRDEITYNRNLQQNPGY